MNIPALSSRTVQRDITDSDFTVTSDIQVCRQYSNYRFQYNCSLYFQVATIKLAASQLPNSRWWIKSDGCDVVSGLMESTRNVWNGDVDYGDGFVQEQHSEYLKRLKFVDDLSSCDWTVLGSKLQTLYLQLIKDGKFVSSGDPI